MASSVLHTQQKLPPGSNFSDAFWDGQNKGVEIIMSRLRKSKDTCEEIKKLYELRANIEQDYGERLLKLAQSSRIGEFEEDSFAETLSRIPSTLETTARAHIDLAQQLKDHLEAPLDGFLKDQRDIRKMQQQQIENSKQLKNLHEADVARARDYYSIECTKLTLLEKYYFSLTSESSKDEIIKIEKEIEEQRRMVTVADQVYRRSVDNFNSVNERWVNDWTSSADKFQEMEVKRISYLRSTLWSFANMMTSTLSIDEECCDRIRTALEITDVQKDITGFVQRYGTGTRIPAPLSYEVLHQSPPIPLTASIQSSTTTIPEVPATAAVAATTAAAAAIITTNDSEHHQQPLSAPVPQQTTVEPLPERGFSESAATKNLPPQPPVTILTNPDEELKSVDHQLQQLEVVQSTTTPQSEDEKHFLMQTSPQQITPQSDEKRELIVENKVEEQPPMSAQPLSGVTNTTDQSNGPVSTAMKDVENLLNQRAFTRDEEEMPKIRNINSNRASYHSNTQTVPPIMMARSIQSDVANTQPLVGAGSDDFSAGIYDALGIKSNNHASQYDLTNNNKEETKPNHSGPAPVELAPLSCETPGLLPFESFQPNNNESHISTESNTQPNHKYKPMPNPIYTNHAAEVASGVLKNKDNSSTNEMTNVAPETVPNQRPVVGVRTSSLMLSSARRQESHDSRESSLNQEVKNDEDDDEDEEDKEYHNRMPRPPPKDEKWVISSIRRPQQLPVRTMNARMFDGTASISRNSVIASPNGPPTTENSPSNVQDVATTPALTSVEDTEESPHHPKVHRPVIPLTIDIPNSVKPTPELPQNAAQQVIAEGRRLSQMSPIQQKMDIQNPATFNQPQPQQQQQQQQPIDRNVMRGYIGQNGMEDGGIRPAPWQEEISIEDRMPKSNSFRGTPTMAAANLNNGYYGNGHNSYQPGMPGPRGSSLKLSSQELQHQQQMHLQQQQQQQMLHQQQQFEEENKKKFAKNSGKQYSESSIKSKENKDNKAGRFSLGFFTGNKKEKKKEKEAAAAAAAAVNVSYNQQDHQQYQLQQQQQQQQQQYMLQQQMYQQELSQSDLKSTHSNSNNNNIQSAPPMQQQQQTPPPQQQQQQQPFEGRFIAYAKAQWPFEATIDGEMTFHAEEVVGIIRKQTDGWWEAERLEPGVSGQRGLVPGNYMIDATPPQ